MYIYIYYDFVGWKLGSCVDLCLFFVYCAVVLTRDSVVFSYMGSALLQH